MNKYLDIDLIKLFPNKYNLTLDNVTQLKVLDWKRLEDYTYYNTAIYLDDGIECRCHTEGCNPPGTKYDEEDEFWIGFYKDNTIKCKFYCYEGMCSYKFPEFYKAEHIENVYDMQVQVNFIRYMNKLIDEGIISQPSVNS